MTDLGRLALRLVSRYLRFLGMAATCAFGALPAHAFVPHPLPGRLVLKLHPGVEVRAGASKANAPVTTGQPGLDVLNARFGVRSFAPQFPGPARASTAFAGLGLSHEHSEYRNGHRRL